MNLRINTLGELFDAILYISEARHKLAVARRDYEHDMLRRGIADEKPVVDAMVRYEDLRATPVQIAALLPADLCDAMAAHLNNTAAHPAETTSPAGHASYLAETAAMFWSSSK